MESLQFTPKETELATERRLKYQGTAKVNLTEIYFNSQSNRPLDRKNVDRLCNIFREEECHNITLEHRIPAIISRQNLAAALQRANLSADALLTRLEPEMPYLQFPGTQLRGLHGRHRVAAGFQVLPPSHRWWAVDLYLDDIGNDLKISLIDEYSNESPPSDGEIYCKIRQYERDGNLHGELRWKARLCPNSQRRLKALRKNTRLRHAFDRILSIPGHRSAMRISMVHRIMALKCDEEISQYLNYVADFWSSLVNNEPTSLAKIDQQTVESLQLMAPRMEAARIHGLVISGQAFAGFESNERELIWGRMQTFDAMIPSLYAFFEDFKCFEIWAQCLRRLFTLTRSTVRATMEVLWECSADTTSMCLVQNSELDYSRWPTPAANHFDLSYRQVWLYVMRHYPDMPPDPKRNTRLAKPTTATADERAVFDMASLADQLGFRSNEITALRQRSPDRAIAMKALLQARKPDRFTYDAASLDSLVNQIASCFATATPKGVERPVRALLDPPVEQDARCGHSTMQALQVDRPLLFLPHMHARDTLDRVTTFYVRRCVYLAFFGPQPRVHQDGNGPSFAVPSSPPSVAMSPLLTSADGNVDVQDYPPAREQAGGHAQQPLESSDEPSTQADTLLLPAEADTVQMTTALQATEREHIRQEAEQQARQAFTAETMRLRAEAEEMARRAHDAEIAAASQAAEMERLRAEAVRQVPQDIQQVGTADISEGLDREGRLETDIDAREASSAPGNQDMSTPPVIEELDYQSSRPLTQIDVTGLLTGWNREEAQPDSDETHSPQYQTGDPPGSRRRTTAEARNKRRKNKLKQRRRNTRTSGTVAAPDDVGRGVTGPVQPVQTSNEGPLVNKQQITQALPPRDQGDVNGPAAEGASRREAGRQEDSQALLTTTIQEKTGTAATTDRAYTPGFDTYDSRLGKQGPQNDYGDDDARSEDLVDDIIRMDAEQREMGEQGQESAQSQARSDDTTESSTQEWGGRVEHERATALAQLQTETEDTSLLDAQTIPVRGARPGTEMDVASLLARWADSASQSENNPAPQSSSSQKRPFRPSPQHSKSAGIGKKRMKGRPTLQEINRAGTQDAAIGDYLGWDMLGQAENAAPLERIESPSMDVVEHRTPQVSAVTNTQRQVRFDVPNQELTSNEPESVATPGEAQSRPVTQYNFRRLAHRGAQITPGQPAGDGRVSITFHLYERDQWRIVNVVRVDPTRRSELDRTVREYKRQGLILHDMKMRTVSVSSSFTAATAGGTNALLLVPRTIKQQMTSPIKPPQIIRSTVQ